jgi:hypothetical protein
MDPQLFALARQLQTKLARINEEADSDLFESVHGLLIELIDGLETAMPALRAKREKAEAKANQQEAARLLKEMKLAGDLPDEPDILEKIKRILGDEGRGDPVGVPAKENRVQRD